MRFLFALTVLSLHVSAPCLESIQDTTTIKIATPSFQQRKTAKIRLSNGLEAYIISDPLLKESGAALSVACGSWNDPANYPGMAHFLEHMLFMGTKAYPDESEYSSFIQTHGGAMNAYTASDKTVYSFTINPQDFEGALDRFSHFFIDPLFSRNSISRELHNVDQEHAKNVENDGSRVYMVFKDTSNPLHPNHAFSTGNADTLGGIPQQVMKDFYHKYYSADKMHLVIMDKAPLEQIVASAKEKFSKVPVTKSANTLPTIPLLSDAQKGSLLHICPLKETKSLSLVWELEKDAVFNPANKTGEFLSYLVSSEAKGQLADRLKSQGFVHQLTSSKDQFSKQQGLFSIDMDLTDKGVANQEEIIKTCLQYLNFLKEQTNLSEIFNQWKSIIQTRYTYQDRGDVFEDVTQLASDLVDEPLASFPEANLIPDSFDMSSFNKLVTSLTPESCLFILLDQKGTFNKTEPWTGAKYSLTPFSKQEIDQLQSSYSLHLFQPLERNPYAPDSFYITRKDHDASQYEVLENSLNYKLLYRPTNLYGLPEYSLKLKLTPVVHMTKSDLSAFMNLFVQAFHKKMIFDLDAAAYCGLKGRLSMNEGSLWLSIEGFNDKAPVLFSKMIAQLQSLQITKEEFDLIKQQTKDSLANTSKELGFRQGLIRFSALFDSSSCMPYEVSQSLKNWDFDSFMRLTKTMKNMFALEGLIIGNAPKEHAQSIKEELSGLVSHKSVPEARLQKVLELDEQKGPFLYKKNLSIAGSSLILALEQEKVSALTRAKTALLMPVLNEQFFDTLRTKQHTGYIAKAYDKEIAQQQFFVFGVQSNSHGALELLYRFELFIEDFVNNFDQRFSEEQFQAVKNSLVEEIKARKENLSVLANHDMMILCNRDGNFLWDQELINALEHVQYEDLKEFAFVNMQRSNKKRVAFLMEGKLPENRKLTYVPSTLENIQSQGTFNLPLFEPVKEGSDGYSKSLLGN